MVDHSLLYKRYQDLYLKKTEREKKWQMCIILFNFQTNVFNLLTACPDVPFSARNCANKNIDQCFFFPIYRKKSSYF